MPDRPAPTMSTSKCSGGMEISNCANCLTAGTISQSSQSQNAMKNAGQDAFGDDNPGADVASASAISSANTGRMNSGPNASPVNLPSGAAISGSSSMTAIAPLIHAAGIRERPSSALSQTTTNALITRS